MAALIDWTMCAGCGHLEAACKCAGSEFRAGDVIRRRGVDNGIRYRIHSCSPGWVHAHRIRQDGQRDMREHGWSGGASMFEVAP